MEILMVAVPNQSLRFFVRMLLKRLIPYLKRADELEIREPLAAFYCRLYAAEQLMKARSPGDHETDAALISILDEAEKLKPGLGANISSEGPQAFEQFAREIFDAALETESAGQVDAAALATRFYFASLFFDVLTQFGPLSPELEEQRNFARAKITQLKRGGVKWAQLRVLLQSAREAADAEDAARAREALRGALDLL